MLFRSSGKRAVCRDFEYRAVAVRVRTTGLCRAIEGVVTALHQRSAGIGAVVGSIERNQRGERARQGQLEQRAIAVRTADDSCAIEIAIFALHQSRAGVGAICGIERNQGGESDIAVRAGRNRPHRQNTDSQQESFGKLHYVHSKVVADYPC